MINFKGLFHGETSVIGLTSLGLAKKIQNNPASQSGANIQSANQLKQNMSLFSAQNSTAQLNFAKTNNSEVLDSLFNSQNILNFKNGNLLG